MRRFPQSSPKGHSFRKTALLGWFGKSAGKVRRCVRLAETLPALRHDPNRPEDVLKVDVDDDGAGGDDAADALRYLVATRPREVMVRKLTGL